MFRKNSSPVFLKDSSDLPIHLQELQKLLENCSSDQEEMIKKDIKLIEYGIYGERCIDYELQSSHFPFYIIKDFYVEYKGVSAQIDYLVFTSKVMFILECKNLYGDIEVNSSGDFIRGMTYGSRKVKEGMYSPVSQNRRHFDLLKKMAVDRQTNPINRHFTEKSFQDYCIPIVVLANPKTIINMKYAKKEVKQQIIRADQLIDHLIHIHKVSKNPNSSEKLTRQWAERYMGYNQMKSNTFLNRYQRNDEVIQKSELNIEETEIYQKLKMFRYNKSKEENIKAYIIFSNKQLEAMIEVWPLDVETLRKKGLISNNQSEKYGSEIVRIFNETKD